MPNPGEHYDQESGRVSTEYLNLESSACSDAKADELEGIAIKRAFQLGLMVCAALTCFMLPQVLETDTSRVVSAELVDLSRLGAIKVRTVVGGVTYTQDCYFDNFGGVTCQKD